MNDMFTVHRNLEYSEIDVAIWSSKFIGCTPIDLELFAEIKSRYPYLEVHTFEESESATDNPFIEEIEKGFIVKQSEPG